MKIVNAMFGRGLGGIEQAFVDYAAALKKSGHSVINLVQPDAKVIEYLWPVTNRITRVKNWGSFDHLSVLKIRKIIADFNPDAIITHGNRAFRLLEKSARGTVPMVGVVHNYKYQKMLSADAFFSITEHLKQALMENGVPRAKIFRIPNMIQIANNAFHFNSWAGRKPVIGVLGRFVKKKGFEDFLLAVSILKARKIEFFAVIAGGGDEEENLKNMVASLGIEEQVKFLGWVKDKKTFFDAIDIFCVPSLHEPFGIVLLEAFAYGKPVASSDSEGPSEIIREEENGLFFPRANPEKMADTLENLIKNPKLAEWIADGGYKSARLEYELSVVAKKISDSLVQITKGKSNG